LSKGGPSRIPLPSKKNSTITGAAPNSTTNNRPQKQRIDGSAGRVSVREQEHSKPA